MCPQHVPGPRPPEQDPLHPLHHRPVPHRGLHPLAGRSTPTPSRGCADQVRRGRRCARSGSSTCSPAAPSPRWPMFGLGHHALHHRVDHHAGPRRWCSHKLEEWQAHGRGRAAQDHPVPRATSPSPSPSCSPPRIRLPLPQRRWGIRSRRRPGSGPRSWSPTSTSGRVVP